jgi:hypothetical protein
MSKLMDKVKMEDEKLDLELEESHGDPNKMKVTLERKINLYSRVLKESDLGDLERLSLENKREWALCHHLIIAMGKESSKKIADLTRRVSKLEKTGQTLITVFEDMQKNVRT